LPVLRADTLNRRGLGHLGGGQFIHHPPRCGNIVQVNPAVRGVEPGFKGSCQFWVEPMSHGHLVSPLRPRNLCIRKCNCISRKHSSLLIELRFQVSPETSLFPV
jgi:hypothetical protein